MNLKSVLLIFVVSLFVSCTSSEKVTQQKLIGTWNWIGSSGGIDGRTETPESTGKSKRLEISSNTIKRYQNGDLVVTNTYTIQTRESIIFGEPREMLVYTENFSQVFELKQNELTLFDMCNDCFVSAYIRD